MKHHWWLILGVLTLELYAQPANKRRQEYIARYKTIAIEEMKTFKIPASIKLAQAILESADGTSRLAVEANNHFGIKCHREWNGPAVYHDDDQKNECFRKYKTAEESFRDHSLFLSERTRYKKLFELPIEDYRSWAYGLREAGYATNPKYPELLIKIIEENQLYQFDREALGALVTGENRLQYHENRIKYIIAQAGDTWESIAKEFDTRVDYLLKYNEVNYAHALQAGDIVFLQPKRRSSRKVKTYTVKPDDDMYHISQQFGIKLKYLYKRNRMSAGEQPQPGTTLYLRGYKPEN
ncbi:glucosaminidase domain-containing protein [Schleiferia thermophila]|jgi:LysM repeat protein|uniref:glucosaminidase domain-containing protein n=1 Tax=Schleiferia thermophila TaxID=884107 RepID=UPI000565CE17|nr:glucosaminidase domain-containing protein [Schleiferia thermophila]